VTYGTFPALVFSAIAGTTLFDLSRREFPQSKEKALKKGIQDAFEALTQYGVEYGDQKLDNFLWVDERVMIIDFEMVRFDAWEENGNSATADSLLREFVRRIDPDHYKEEDRAYMHAFEARADEERRRRKAAVEAAIARGDLLDVEEWGWALGSPGVTAINTSGKE